MKSHLLYNHQRCTLRLPLPLRRTPWTNWAIIVANVIVFLISGPRGEHAASSTTETFGLMTRQPELYQFFTYQFLHAGGGLWFVVAGK